MVCFEVPIVAIFNTGSFAPLVQSGPEPDKSGVQQSDKGTLYKIDLNYQKVEVVDHIRWCRRNLGDRHNGWDFWMAGNMLYIEIWGDKQKFTYEMWKN